MALNPEWIKNNRFQLILVLLLLTLFVFMAVKSSENLFVSERAPVSIQDEKQTRQLQKSKTVEMFHHPNCHSCQEQIRFIQNELRKKYPDVRFNYHDITISEENELMRKYYEQYGINPENRFTPSTFIAQNYLIGYEGDDKSGKQLEIMIKSNILEQQLSAEEQSILAGLAKGRSAYVETWFGRVNVFEKSLPFLAVVLGLADGFNPCALWVLVYLISLIAGLRDKSKIWLIVGSFVLASGVLYFLLMTALLNVFLYIGYLRILELIFGCTALYIGITDLKIYLVDKGHAACKVGGVESKSRLRSKIKSLVEAKLTILTILGVIGLAFVVNSMEFVCSAALPAIYTGVLSQAGLSPFTYYFYILLYVFFFLLNQIVIFSTAAFTIERFAPERYMVHIQLIGGVILIALGVIMVFFPGYLR